MVCALYARASFPASITWKSECSRKSSAVLSVHFGRAFVSAAALAEERSFGSLSARVSRSRFEGG
jgi:hypothetical protein